jgi:chromosome partitioning protein
MGTVLSFINLKGGVGKTACCINIGATLARSRKKVLIIDVDAQGNATTWLMGTERYIETLPDDSAKRKTVYQIFLDAIEHTNEFDANEAIIKSVVRKDGDAILPTLDLLPTTHHLMELEKKIVSYERTKSRILSGQVSPLKSIYDYILIDCPPNIYTATHSALYSADYYVIPTVPDFLSMAGLELLVRELNRTVQIAEEERQYKPQLAGIIISRLHKRFKVHQRGLTDLERLLDKFKSEQLVEREAIIFPTHIRELTVIKEASSEFLPVCIYKRRSDSTAEYYRVTNDILRRIGQPLLTQEEMV